MPEQVDSNGNASDLCSKVVQFKSRLKNQVSWWFMC